MRIILLMVCGLLSFQAWASNSIKCTHLKLAQPSAQNTIEWKTTEISVEVSGDESNSLAVIESKRGRIETSNVRWTVSTVEQLRLKSMIATLKPELLLPLVTSIRVAFITITENPVEASTIKIYELLNAQEKSLGVIAVTGWGFGICN